MEGESSAEFGATDLSGQVTEYLQTKDPVQKIGLKRKLIEACRMSPSVTVTLDYTTLQDAKFLKSLLENEPSPGMWKFAIRATESQMAEAANIFASGVEWIKVEG